MGQEDDSIPIPPAFEADGDDPTDILKKENAFWAGVISGVAIWVLALLSLGGVYVCCKKGSSGRRESAEINYASNYHDLPASQ